MNERAIVNKITTKNVHHQLTMKLKPNDGGHVDFVPMIKLFGMIIGEQFYFDDCLNKR